MTTTTSSNITETVHNLAATRDGQATPMPYRTRRHRRGGETTAEHDGKPESELRAAARRKGLNLKELAALMGVSYRYLGQVANGHRPWSPMMRERALAVLGEVPGQGMVYRQDGVLKGGESTYIRERARERGLTLRQVADRAGVSYRFMSDVSRGRRNFSPGVQARGREGAECAGEGRGGPEALRGPQRAVGADGRPPVEPERDRAAGGHQPRHALPGNERPAHPVGGPAAAAARGVVRAVAGGTVAPVELKVLAWKKGGRNGVVVKGAGGPGNGTIRTGGHVPWGAEVEFAYTSGYDNQGRVSVNHLVDERGCSVMLNKQQRQ